MDKVNIVNKVNSNNTTITNESKAIVFSPEQQEAINYPVSNLLVSAAAGSGKTTVLVERIITKIVEGAYDVDQILVMTFTREAAENMSTKIINAIRKKITELSVDYDANKDVIKQLRNQLDKMPNCYIQTIDAFCSRVVKEKGYVCADNEEMKLVEPGNAILDNNELDLILRESIEAAIEELYQECPENSESDSESYNKFLYFERLTHLYGNGRTDKALVDAVVSIYKRLRSIPDYLDRCDEDLAVRESADTNGELLRFDNVVDRLMDVYRLITPDLVANLCDSVEEVVFLADNKKNIQRREFFSSLFDAIGDYASNVVKAYDGGKSSTEVMDAIKNGAATIKSNFTKIEGLPGTKGKSDDEIVTIKAFNEMVGPIGALVKLLKNQLGLKSTPVGYGATGEAYYPGDAYVGVIDGDMSVYLAKQKERTAITKAFISLINKVDKLYAANKMRVHGMDFADQEHFAKKILETDEARGYYKNKFREIYIDEYQDNSELQDAIIYQIKSDAGNVFRVGDVKQSIYKFRFAKPKMFLDLLDSYLNDEKAGKLICLNQNHRSSNEILDFCNAVFNQLMSSKATEIEYDDTQKLNYGFKGSTGVVPDVIVVNDYGLRKSSVDVSGEVRFNNPGFLSIKQTVEGYINAGYKPEQIMILTRRRTAAARICNFLNDGGIPSKYADELSIFSDNDIHGICNVIISLANELRDEYLVGVLLSGYRISNFTLDEVATIHLFAKMHEPSLERMNLITKLRVFAEEGDEKNSLVARVNRFIDWFDDVRHDVLLTDISDLVDRIYKDTGVGSLGDEVLNKYELFKDWLCSNFLRYGSDISTIALKLEDMKIKLGNNTGVRVESANDSKVTCMTMHASKGLEKECVIVCDLESSTSDKEGNVVYSDSLGFVVNDYNEEDISCNKSIERIVRDEEEKLANVSEDIRLLYVALTRAKERLSVILTMTLSKEDGSTAKSTDNKMAMLYRNVLKQPSLGISRQHWINGSNSLSTEMLTALVRMDAAGSLKKQICNYYNKGDELSVLCPVHFDGVNIVIDNESEKDKLNTDNSDDALGDSEIDVDAGMESDESRDENVLLELSMQELRTNIVDVCCDGFDENGLPIIEPYSNDEISKIPFKVSVSQIKENGIEDAVGLPLSVNDFSFYRDKYTGIVGDTAADIGTFVHKLLRFIDLRQLRANHDVYESLINEMFTDGIVRKSELDIAIGYKEYICKFADSELANRLILADEENRAEYEKPIIFSTPIGDDYALVQGIIDAVFYESDGAVIIDYKTDSMFDVDDSSIARSESVRTKHSKQINCYAEAISASGTPVKARYIVLLRYGEIVEIN